MFKKITQYKVIVPPSATRDSVPFVHRCGATSKAAAVESARMDAMSKGKLDANRDIRLISTIREIKPKVGDKFTVGV